MTKLNTAISFLSEVWGKQCRTGDFVFICTNNPKKDKSWKDHAIKYDKELPHKIEKILKRHDPRKEDIYFCPLPFADSVRDKNKVKRSKLLWQDLDYADPYKFPTDLKPTIFWESSPGRYHGLWEMKKMVHSNRMEEVETLNRDLAYELDADHGGWDLTQVLRVPGTFNHKYDEKPKVTRKKANIKPYDFSALRAKVKRQVSPLSQEKMEPLKEGNAREVLARWKSKMPRDLLVTLMQKRVPVGERSETIWSLENTMYEMGMPPADIFTLIKHSQWNKYRGREDEDERLQTELEKVTSKATQQEEQEINIIEGAEYGDDGMSLNVETFQEVMGKLNTQPGWLVEGFWARRSHGIVAGEPKTFKSTYIMDLAISVASGRNFLGKYPVLEKGPVIYIQNENADWIIKDRMEKIVDHRNLDGKVIYNGDRKLEISFPTDLPLYFINQQNYMLNDPIHQEILEELIEEVKPVLIIFDPLYLMFDGDLNSAKDLGPVLNYLLNLKNKYKTGVIAVHHYNKSQQSSRGGQKMLGSAILHGFTESAWYLRRKQEDEGEDIPDNWDSLTPEEQAAHEADVHSKPSTIIMEREFRNSGPGKALEITLQMGPLGENGYDVDVNYYRGENTDTVTVRESFDVGVVRAFSDLLDSDKPKEFRITEIGNILGANSLAKSKGKIIEAREILASSPQLDYQSTGEGKFSLRVK